MLKARQIELAAELAIDALQQVEIEAGRHALCVVVGGLEAPRILVEVDAGDQSRAGAEDAGEMRQKAASVRRIEVADRGARKEAELGMGMDARRQSQRLAEAGIDRDNLQAGETLLQPPPGIGQIGRAHV